MKKTYIVPEMNVIKIASHQQMLAGSPVRFNGGGSGEADLLDDDPDDGDAMSRGFDW